MMRSVILFSCLIVSHSLFAGDLTVAIRDTFTIPGAVYSGNTQGLSINDHGMVVGRYNDSSSVTHGFIYDPVRNTIQTLDYPGAVHTEATGINNSGTIAGCFTNYTGGGCYRAFLYLGGKFADITYPGAFISPPGGINDPGQVVGVYVTASGPGGAYIYSPGGGYADFSYPGASFTQLSGINNSGMLIGQASSLSFFYNGSYFTTIQPAGSGATAPGLLGINNGGAVLGSGLGDPRHFLFYNGQYFPVSLPSHLRSSLISGLNSSNMVVGTNYGVGFIGQIVE